MLWCLPGLARRGPKTDDEVWQQLGALRRRCGEQEEQIDRQEAIILALQQRAPAASAASTPTGAGLGATGSARPWDGGGAMEQQMRLLEVRRAAPAALRALHIDRSVWHVLLRGVTPADMSRSTRQ